ncbi:MarR family winged helix-turn-helix transcriptional regulator [Mycolicibacterium vanbaalenii]|uniref:Transcriptional regulator, MarR family n=1 Tax=Mycolicibacterium vanbaalenii (strain DSM 7251 / JCM 13017 / BCRC 16820 / KCTC 9966 / NRRL B-24157 / PYR-1) TaxID=350058 RepID=A1T1E9_MYCVP|nr:MarR family winged helix-turn-helix transcriptional regulator [Mycolicibacterium vanbaalenii]ABM10999.1 transcriptional regulator, MarR family [Mycolicibacterium vanbaalenii PYR-1]MCV7130705.1 winged helix-turn-helix transcriptional regulator [Mycolicibacterium vanbaalenii PYR-1]
MEWLSDEQQLIWRNYLAMVSRLHTAMHRQLQQDCELSLSDYDVLVALSERGPMRINELGELIGWEQSRLSHQLRRMRGRGLVGREGDGDDRRGATVALTDAGLAALRTAAPGHVDLVRTMVFDGLTPAAQREFGAAVETVLSRLRAAGSTD